MELALDKYSVFFISPAHPKGLQMMYVSKLKAAYFHQLQMKLPSIKTYKGVKALLGLKCEPLIYQGESQQKNITLRQSYTF